MAEVQLAPTSAKQVWRKQYIMEYTRDSRLLPYIGPGSSTTTPNTSGRPMPIIQRVNDLSVGAGNVINIPLLTQVKGQGVSGAQMLIGNEDEMGNYNAQVATDWIRNGIRVPKSTSYKTDIDLWGAAKPQLRQWSANKLRDNLIQAMGSVIVPGYAFIDPTTGASSLGADQAIPYSLSTSSQLNAYLANNIDRILFGQNVSNTSSGVWATSLANVDSTNDKLSTGVASLAKRMAKRAGTTLTSLAPHFRPYMVPEVAREYFVMFCASNSFRDLKNDPNMINANREARAREGAGMDKNPIFQDGDLIYDGVIFVEFPELDALKSVGAGAGGIDVDMNIMCGQQALVLAYSQATDFVLDMKYDYEFRPGVAVQECRGQKKLSYNGTMLGVLPVLTASTPDT